MQEVRADIREVRKDIVDLKTGQARQDGDIAELQRWRTSTEQNNRSIPGWIMTAISIGMGLLVLILNLIGGGKTP